MSNKKNKTEEVVDGTVKTANRTLTFHAFATTANPTRRTYRVQGHKGVLVIERSLFADGDGPEELVLNVDLVEPMEKAAKVGSAEREQARLVKAQEKADKAAARLKAQQEKADLAAAKATAALEAAKKASVTAPTA